MYDFLHEWALEHEPSKCGIWFADKEKMLGILRLYMGIGMKRRRKDFIYARQVFELVSYFFDIEEGQQEKDGYRSDSETVKAVLNEYLATYRHDDDNNEWFNKLKAIADKFPFYFPCPCHIHKNPERTLPGRACLPDFKRLFSRKNLLPPAVMQR